MQAGCEYQEVEIIGGLILEAAFHTYLDVVINAHWRITQKGKSWLLGRHSERYDLIKGPS